MNSFLFDFLLIVHVFLCVFIILLVLIQSDKGGGLAGALGGMSNAALSGASAETIITKATRWVAAIMLVIIMYLNWMAGKSNNAPAAESELEKGNTYYQKVINPGTSIIPGVTDQPDGGLPTAPAGEAPTGGLPTGNAPSGEESAPAELPKN